MIYVFPCGAIHYQGEQLSDIEKAKAVAVEELPQTEHREGFESILKSNKDTDTVYYEYIKIPTTESELIENVPTLEDKINYIYYKQMGVI